MDNNNTSPKLIKTRWGYYQYEPQPTDEELQRYYETKYYQEGMGSYSVSYSEEELDYFRLKADLMRRKVVELEGAVISKRLMDIGCGEGWVMSEFLKQGANVSGIDFSSHGIEKWNSHVLPCFQKANIYDVIYNKQKDEPEYDILILANVIEHVKEPDKLLSAIKRFMTKGSLLIIVAPNDYSRLQDHLIQREYISTKYWLCYPDHLSYFNKDSMCRLLCDLGYEVRSIVADNPIDMNLLNDNSNYVRDKTKGRNTHLYRIRADNFIGQVDSDKLLKIYEILGSMGIGRDLTYYCSLDK